MLFDDNYYLQHPKLFAQMPDRTTVTGQEYNAYYRQKMKYPTGQGNGTVVQPGPYARSYPTGYKPQYTWLDETLEEYDKTRPEPYSMTNPQAIDPVQHYGHDLGIEFSDAKTGTSLIDQRYARPDEIAAHPDQGQFRLLDPEMRYQNVEPNPKFAEWTQGRDQITAPFLNARAGVTTPNQPKLTQEEMDAITKAPGAMREAKSKYEKAVAPGIVRGASPAEIEAAGNAYNSVATNEADKIKGFSMVRPDIVNAVINPDDFQTTPTKMGGKPEPLLPWMGRRTASISPATPADPNSGIEQPKILTPKAGGRVELQPDGSAVWTKKDGSSIMVTPEQIKIGMANGTLR